MTECAFLTEPPVFNRPWPLATETFVRAVNKSITLDCKAKGTPKPEFVWFKDHRQLDNRKPTLRLSRLSRRDAGNYECVAENVFGNISTSFEVKINPPPATAAPTIDGT